MDKKGFLNETESISADTKSALLNMADKTQDGIFREWVETLVRCQDDRSLKDALQPIVSKLSDVRTVNTELDRLFFGNYFYSFCH